MDVNEGEFWLAGAETHRVPGSLDLSAGWPTLHLFGELISPWSEPVEVRQSDGSVAFRRDLRAAPAGSEVERHVVHGIVRDLGRVSLPGAYVTSLSMALPGR
jgi:hypothetical protein